MQTGLTTNVQSSVSNVGQWFAANQSRLIAAFVLIVVGVLLAMLLRALAVRTVRAIERALPGRDFNTTFAGIARERRVSDVVGTIVFWAVLVFFIATATNALGLPLLNSAVFSLSTFIPRVLAAVLIMVVGLVLGNLARGAVTAAAASSGAAIGPTIGHVVRMAIVIAAALIAAAELGVDITLLTAIFSVALAALLGGFALAFGLGARTAMSNIIGSHYLRQTFDVGQTVRIGGVEGVITDLTSTAVILQVADGRVIVPAKQFSELPSTLVVKGGAS
ncbi:MAG TPA: mechanosensitive ion channel domain-containing protein [Gemmatimonadaceae bacterium]|nr:mechanosensitive ion channel domain-containing protein [Gemmatimonadaceae bacterium]